MLMECSDYFINILCMYNKNRSPQTVRIPAKWTAVFLVNKI